jgi:hypothetical protein
MFGEGYRELMGTGSPYPVGEELPKLQRMCYVEVPSLFQPFTLTPHPGSFDPMIKSLQKALDKLCYGSERDDPIYAEDGPYPANLDLFKMATAGDLIQDWVGSAAMAFKADFIDPFPALASNQFLIVSALKSALRAEQEVWAKMRDDIDAVAEAAVKCLDAMHRTCGGHEWRVALTVVSAGAGFLAAVPNLGTAAVAAAGAVAGGASLVASAIEVPEPPELTIQGSTVAGVFTSLYEAVKRVTEEVNSAEDRIARALRALADAVRADRAAYVANRPALADATARTVTGDDYLGYAS